jgi:hypothetical protein
VGEVFGAIAIANTIAYVSEVMDPKSIFIGLTRRGLMGQAARYLLFGEGETGLIVYTILLGLDARGGRASPHLLDVRLNFDSVDHGRRSRAARTRNGMVHARYCRKKTVLKSRNVAKTSSTAR